ncbi:hypothetical protein EJB05_54322, partial [Eragrostis curvula]
SDPDVLARGCMKNFREAPHRQQSIRYIVTTGHFIMKSLPEDRLYIFFLMQVQSLRRSVCIRYSVIVHSNESSLSGDDHEFKWD